MPADQRLLHLNFNTVRNNNKMASSQTGLQSGIKGILSPSNTPNQSISHPRPSLQRNLHHANNPCPQNQHHRWYTFPSIFLTIESLEPNGTIDRTSTAEEDFSQLQEWCKDNEAGYIIYFLDSPSDNYFFISYVPDNTNVPPLITKD
jgi:hypothetical protein